jgi:energy-coupling factor transporter ATP-binding protein EcfA2
MEGALMTIIREFRINGLAGHAGEVHQVLHPQLNIFWGLNGSGKTTLLRILNAAISNKSQTIKDLPFDRASVTFYSEGHDAEFTRTLERKSIKRDINGWGDTLHSYFDSESDEEIHYRSVASSSEQGWVTKVTHGLPTEGLDASYKHSYLPISRMLDYRPSERVRAGSGADDRFANRVNQVWSLYSRKSLAEVRDVQQFGLAEILAILFGGRSQLTLEGLPTAGEGEQETEARNAFAIVSQFLAAQNIWLPLGERDFTERYEDSEAHRHVVTRIRSITKQVDQIQAPQRELESVIDEMYIGNKRAVLNRQPVNGNIVVHVDSKEIPLDALSSGEKQVLQILLETMAVEESTIMVDEPELSLHPDWQKRLVRSMRRVNSRAQFILATHSPELMLDVDDECVFEL